LLSLARRVGGHAGEVAWRNVNHGSRMISPVVRRTTLVRHVQHSYVTCNTRTSRATLVRHVQHSSISYNTRVSRTTLVHHVQRIGTVNVYLPPEHPSVSTLQADAGQGPWVMHLTCVHYVVYTTTRMYITLCAQLVTCTSPLCTQLHTSTSCCVHNYTYIHHVVHTRVHPVQRMGTGYLTLAPIC
jgi:hypothetical protein